MQDYSSLNQFKNSEHLHDFFSLKKEIISTLELCLHGANPYK